MKTLINIHHQEIGAKMAEIGCGERMSRIEKLMLWAQERALQSLEPIDIGNMDEPWKNDPSLASALSDTLDRLEVLNGVGPQNALIDEFCKSKRAMLL